MTILLVFNNSSNVWLLLANLSNHTSSLYNTWILGFFHYYQNLRQLCSTLSGRWSRGGPASSNLQNCVSRFFARKHKNTDIANPPQSGGPAMRTHLGVAALANGGLVQVQPIPDFRYLHHLDHHLPVAMRISLDKSKNNKRVGIATMLLREPLLSMNLKTVQNLEDHQCC